MVFGDKIRWNFESISKKLIQIAMEHSLSSLSWHDSIARMWTNSTEQSYGFIFSAFHFKRASPLPSTTCLTAISWICWLYCILCFFYECWIGAGTSSDVTSFQRLYHSSQSHWGTYWRTSVQATSLSNLLQSRMALSITSRWCDQLDPTKTCASISHPLIFRRSSLSVRKRL